MQKMQQEGSKNDEKIMKNRSPGVGKLRKMGARGAFQMQQNAKLKKIGVVLNSLAGGK